LASLPPNAAAADFQLTLLPPTKMDRRITATEQNHPAPMPKNYIGTGL